jgi:6-pyruvoyl-tetrahydropterin synthase
MLALSRTREASFSHLIDDGGKCARLHGHNWVFNVEIFLDDDDINLKSGMILDIKEIDKLIDVFDHKLVISKRQWLNIDGDKIEIAVSDSGKEKKYIIQKEDVLIIDAETVTAEGLAKYIHSEICKLLAGIYGEGISAVIRVEVSETDRMKVSYEKRC